MGRRRVGKTLGDWALFFPSPELSIPFLGNSEQEPILVNLTTGAVWVYIYGYRYR